MSRKHTTGGVKETVQDPVTHKGKHLHLQVQLSTSHPLDGLIPTTKKGKTNNDEERKVRKVKKGRMSPLMWKGTYEPVYVERDV